MCRLIWSCTFHICSVHITTVMWSDTIYHAEWMFSDHTGYLHWEIQRAWNIHKMWYRASNHITMVMYLLYTMQHQQVPLYNYRLLKSLSQYWYSLVNITSCSMTQSQWLSSRVSALWPGGCGFTPRPGHIKDFKNGTSCSFTWCPALRK